MKIIFDTNKIKVEYNPYVGKVRAMYNSIIIVSEKLARKCKE